MSQSKARLQQEADDARTQMIEQAWMSVQLLQYIVEVQAQYPEIEWPPLPNTITEAMWRAVLVP